MKTIAIIPVYNEKKTIISLLEDTYSYVDIIIVINDGSTDLSEKRIVQWTVNHNNVYYLNINKNRGMAIALGMGFYLVCHLMALGTISEEDLIVNIDADAQHDPKDIFGLVDYISKNNLDLVTARRDFSFYPFHKKIGNKLMSLFASLLTWHKYNDVECGYRILRTVIVPNIMQYYTGYRYSCAQELGIIAALLGYKVDNNYAISIQYYRSNTKLKDVFINLFLGLVSFIKVKLNIKSDVNQGINKSLEYLKIKPEE